VNKTMFAPASVATPLVPLADTSNAAGGAAYSTSDEKVLAQIACTGTFGNTFYINGETQLAQLIAAAERVSPEYLAQVTVYAHQHGLMKDTPAVLLALLLGRSHELFGRVFPLVINNAKMLHNFAAVIRSGVTGRRNFGSVARKLVSDWLINADTWKLLNGASNNNPSLGDIINMVHPRPKDAAQAAFFKWFANRSELTFSEHELLPEQVRALDNFVANRTDDTPIPDVPFFFLEGLELSHQQRLALAAKTSPVQSLKMINTFNRNNLFGSPLPGAGDVTFKADLINRLERITFDAKTKLFPFQAMTALHALEGAVPGDVKATVENLVNRAMTKAPVLKGTTVVAVDISSSMRSMVLGRNDKASTNTSCVDVAALIGVGIVKCNPENSILVLFNDNIGFWQFNHDHSVVTVANEIARITTGGTNTPLVIEMLLQSYAREKASGNSPAVIDNVIIVSDNESWIGASGGNYTRGGVPLQARWQEYLKEWNPKAKMLCININPEKSVQVKDTPNAINIGGFSDIVFQLMDDYFNNDTTGDFWVDRIKATVAL